MKTENIDIENPSHISKLTKKQISLILEGQIRENKRLKAKIYAIDELLDVIKAPDNFNGNAYSTYGRLKYLFEDEVVLKSLLKPILIKKRFEKK